MNRYLVSHTTTYRYNRPVRFGKHTLVVHPTENAQLHHFDLSISPDYSVTWDRDSHGNKIATAQFQSKARRLVFKTELDVSIQASEKLPYTLELPDRPEPENEVQIWAKGLVEDDVRSTFQRIAREIFETLEYRHRAAEGTQASHETLKKRIGACRDFSVLLADALEYLGFRTRIVSGYLYSKARDVSPAPAGGDTHAWVQVYVPSVGWYDIDPTNGKMGNEGLIPVATWPPKAKMLAAVSGTWIGCVGEFIDLKVTVNVRRHKEDQ